MWIYKSEIVLYVCIAQVIQCYPGQRWSNRTRVLVLVLEYEYFLSSSTKESNRTRTRVHYQSNRTHNYFSRLNCFHMNSCKQIY